MFGCSCSDLSSLCRLVNRSGTPICSHVVSSSNLLCFLVQQAWRFLRTPEQVQTCALFVTDSIISPCASWAPPCPGFTLWFWVPRGLTRTMTSDLPVRLGSCVLSVPRGYIVICDQTPEFVGAPCLAIWLRVSSLFVQGMASELEIIPAQFRVALERLGITSMQHLAHGVLSFPALQLALPGFQEADSNLLWFRIQREQTRPWTSPSSASLSTTSGTTAVAELALTFPSRSEWCGVPLPQLQPTSSALPLVQSGSVAQSFSTTRTFFLDDARKKQRVVKVGAGETEVVHTLGLLS